ncbi:unnamed protein product [Ectocarpus fasciculatus]
MSDEFSTARLVDESFSVRLNTENAGSVRFTNTTTGRFNIQSTPTCSGYTPLLPNINSSTVRSYPFVLRALSPKRQAAAMLSVKTRTTDYNKNASIPNHYTTARARTCFTNNPARPCSVAARLGWSGPSTFSLIP